jgi:tripartite-type tricarboxylate transporter receptor subunit TctC
MKKRTLCLYVVFFILLAFNLPKEIVAAPYYEGKVIKIVVALQPGGGYDRMARILAKHLPKYIPGSPTIIVENMPGASGMVGANYVYNMSKHDGLIIGSINRVTPSAQLLKIEGVKFDLLKYSWIGSAAVETSAFFVRTDLPYNTYEDLKRAKEINVGATGPGDITYTFAILIKQYLGVNLKITTGYVGTPDIVLATERKEVDGYAAAFSSMRPYIARGLLRPLLRSATLSPGSEKLPNVEDLATEQIGKTIFKMFSVSDRVGRPYVCAPGTPADIMKILRDAFAKAAEDPELRKEADKMMMEVEYVPADDCMKEMQFFLNQPQDVVNEFRKFIKF